METGRNGQPTCVVPAPDLGTQLEDLLCSVWECEDLVRFESRIGLALTSTRPVHEAVAIQRNSRNPGH